MSDPAERALEAWRALAENCFLHASGEFRVVDGPAGRGAHAALWPYSQVLHAAAAISPLDPSAVGLEPLFSGLEVFRRDDAYAPRPRGRRRYYDDNAWVGLALCQLHLVTTLSRFLAPARRLARFLLEGEDPAGGVRWVEGRRAVNTCSTAPAAELALRLHLARSSPKLLAFAVRSIAWLDATLRRPTGLYADHLHRGRIEPAIWSYNQGAPAGAHALLYRATGDERHLVAAGRTAAAATRRFRGERRWTHPPVFNAIYYRNLLAIDPLTRVDGLEEDLDAYLDRAWRRGRDGRTGLFTAGGIGSYDGSPAIDQAGLVQLFALRAWPPERLPDVC